MIARVPSILIVDHDCRRSAELRDRLVKDHVQVDVVSSLQAALAFCRCKPVAVAIVYYADDPQTQIVCDEMRAAGHTDHVPARPIRRSLHRTRRAVAQAVKRTKLPAPPSVRCLAQATLAGTRTY